MAVDGPLAGQNTVGSEDIINSEVKTGDIGDAEVSGNDLAPDSVGGGKIVDRQVKNADLSIGASSSNTIADGGIQGIDVKNDTLTGAHVANNSLPGADLTDNSVTSAKIADARGNQSLDRGRRDEAERPGSATNDERGDADAEPGESRRKGVRTGRVAKRMGRTKLRVRRGARPSARRPGARL
jgi:hypothetical protein